MSLQELNLSRRYRSDTCSNIGREFLCPTIKEGVTYWRATGYFSSSSLISISRGLSYLTQKPGAQVKIVCSPKLSQDDVRAISQGYQNRKDIVDKILINNFSSDSLGDEDKERLNYLCHLIEQGILDIKIAITDRTDTHGVSVGDYHEKFGLIEDEIGNIVAFEGSLNESENGYENNFENIRVYRNWDRTESSDIDFLKSQFDDLWNNRTNCLTVFDFPEAAKKKLFEFRNDSFHPDIDDWINRRKKNRPSYNFPHDLHDYQRTAIENWKNSNFHGIFDMATGTGKTVTAYAAMLEFLNHAKGRGFICVVCPQLHLSEQWIDDSPYFNIRFIRCDSSNPNYERQVTSKIYDYNDRIIDDVFLITTYSTFSTNKFQRLLHKVKGNTNLIVADEVHNFGAGRAKSAMSDFFTYRLGLSATTERKGDDEGTASILKYFGNYCIHFSLKDAIEGNYLTHYQYFPIFVPMTAEEQDKYIELTEKLSSNIRIDNGQTVLTEAGKKIAIKRARLIALASNKLNALKEAIEPYRESNNIIVYCGMGSLDKTLGISTDSDSEENQINEVINLLGNDLNMKVSRYTFKEGAKEKRTLKEDFESHKIQALVAMKCLDEGVNIPSITTAFILASSTNPREYIQRRGRVLRLARGKDCAYIYDFVTLPFLNEKSSTAKYFVSLARNEIARITEFKKLSINPFASDKIITSIESTFDLDKFDAGQSFENYQFEDSLDE